MVNNSLVSIAQYSKEKILSLIEMTREFELHPNRRLLAGKVIATLFFLLGKSYMLSISINGSRC